MVAARDFDLNTSLSDAVIGQDFHLPLGSTCSGSTPCAHFSSGSTLSDPIAIQLYTPSSHYADHNISLSLGSGATLEITLTSPIPPSPPVYTLNSPSVAPGQPAVLLLNTSVVLSKLFPTMVSVLVDGKTYSALIPPNKLISNPLSVATTHLTLSHPLSVSVQGQVLASITALVSSSTSYYIADTTNSVIRKVDSSGMISTVAGNNSSGYSGDGGPATSAQLFNPRQVLTDSSGNIYIDDSSNNAIRKIDTNGIITTIAGGNGRGHSGDGGPATDAVMDFPLAVAFDSANNVYILDGQNSAVRKVDALGVITTIAGGSGQGYSGDGGLATAAQLNYSGGLWFDSSGNLYIADTGNSVIRKVDTNGIITTVAGNGTYGYSGDGGPATAAEISYPADLIF